MSKILCLTDLDDTLFNSERKSNENNRSSVGWFNIDGSIGGYLSKEQELFWSWINNTTTVCPITARRANAFSRVNLKFSSWQAYDFGLVILKNNKEDLLWQEKQIEKIKADQHDFIKLKSSLKEMLFDGFALRNNFNITEEVVNNYCVYINIKNKNKNTITLQKLFLLLDSFLDKNVFKLIFNDNNLSILPKWLDKKEAAQYIIEEAQKEEYELFIGIGDSISDLGFMTICDWAIMPKVSQINNEIIRSI